MRTALTKNQVIQAIERTSDSAHVPLLMCKWWGVGTAEKYGTKLTEMAAKYPDDIYITWHTAPGADVSPIANPDYRFGFKADYRDASRHSIAEAPVVLPSWDELDLFLENFPNPHEKEIFDPVINDMQNAGNRYKVGGFWNVFHEQLWKIRGMENLFVDYFDEMGKLKIVAKKILEFHKVIVDRYAALGFDGIFTSDDLGHQSGPMMSPAIFKEFYLPLYKEFISYVHSKGMHVFLHSCGDNSLLMNYLVEAKLDVFHPVQKGCMDEKETAEKFGDNISFLYGIDVQHLLPEGTVEDVRSGIIDAAKTFYKKSGGLLFAAGNGIMPDVPLENIECMLETVTNIKSYILK